MFCSRDHRDTKLDIELRMSSNELDGTRVELGCEMRCEAYLCFSVESINDFEILYTKREKDITRILAKRTLSVSINALLEKSFD